MFEVIFYYNRAENNRVDKTDYIEQKIKLQGSLRESCSIIAPSLDIEVQLKDYELMFSSNYCKIPIFHRYYYIDDIIAVSNSIYRISLACDVLMSFKKDILNLECFIDRQEYDFDKMLPDNRRPITSDTKINKKYINVKSYTIGNSTITPHFWDADLLHNDFKENIYEYRFVLLLSGISQVAKLNPTDINVGYSFLAPISSTSRLVITNRLGLNFLLKYIYSEDFSKNLELLTNTLNGCIIKIIEFPFDLKPEYNPFLINLSKIKDESLRKIAIGTLTFTVGDYTDIPDIRTVGCYFDTPENSWVDYNDYLTEYYNLFPDINIYKISTEEFTLSNKQDISYIDAPNFTTYRILLPYYGYYNIEDYNLITKKLRLDFYINISSGECMCKIMIIDNDIEQLFDTVQYSIGWEISYSESNKNEQNRNVLFNGIGLTMKLLTRGIFGSNGSTSILTGTKNITNTSNDGKVSQKNIRFSSTKVTTENDKASEIQKISTYVLDSIPMFNSTPKNSSVDNNFNNLFITRYGDGSAIVKQVEIQSIAPVLVGENDKEYDKKYAKMVGKPCSYNKTLSELYGYTEVSALHVENIEYAMSEEISEIENALKKGILLKDKPTS